MSSIVLAKGRISHLGFGLDRYKEFERMFTHVKSTIRHIAPAALNGRSLLRVVYVVLEAQYQSALSAAVRSINDTHPQVAIEISGYLLEELRNPENYAAFCEDVARANVFIASLIFIEDLADKVVEAVQPYRDRLDVAVVFPSLPQVMRLNKMGSFSLAQIGQSKSVIANFMKKRKEKSGAGLPRRHAQTPANPAPSPEVPPH